MNMNEKALRELLASVSDTKKYLTTMRQRAEAKMAEAEAEMQSISKAVSFVGFYEDHLTNNLATVVAVQKEEK